MLSKCKRNLLICILLYFFSFLSVLIKFFMGNINIVIIYFCAERVFFLSIWVCACVGVECKLWLALTLLSIFLSDFFWNKSMFLIRI